MQCNFLFRDEFALQKFLATPFLPLSGTPGAISLCFASQGYLSGIP
jgi:hypothetical protein